MPQTGDAHYDLRLREGPVLHHLRLNEGITLSADGLAWPTDGEEHARAYADIDNIRLQFGYVEGDGNICTCTIAFRDGLILYVYSTKAIGEAAGARAPTYRAFVHDLHARIPAAARKRIGFFAGESEGRQTYGRVMLVVAALFFIAMPIVLFLISSEWKMLGITFFGFTLIIPFARVLSRNKPHTYNPARVPDELMP